MKKIKGKLIKLLKFLGLAATVEIGFGPQKNEPPKVVQVQFNLRNQERQGYVSPYPGLEKLGHE